MSRYRVRNAGLRDLPGVSRLAQMLNTMNLPNEIGALQEVIEKSEKSFQGEITNPFEREYVFVVEDLMSGLVIGSSQIISQHGTKEYPHIFYDVAEVEHYSKTVDKLFKHQVLRLGFNYDGPTEVGGLILDPEYRNSPERLGKQLSFIRFMFIGMYRSLFKERLLAELLPPFSPSGQSLLWEALGRRFTDLDYLQADHISRNNKEFIKSLFPPGQIYSAFFDQETKAVIGAVGNSSKAACQLLTQIGFIYQHRVDPFDGGPHFEAETKNVLPVHATRPCILELLDKSASKNIGMRHGLVAVFKNPFTCDAQFFATCISFGLSTDIDVVYVDREAFTDLHANSGDNAFVLDVGI
jgi:arginine N-succinyltransferase